MWKLICDLYSHTYCANNFEFIKASSYDHLYETHGVCGCLPSCNDIEYEIHTNKINRNSTTRNSLIKMRWKDNEYFTLVRFQEYNYVHFFSYAGFRAFCRHISTFNHWNCLFLNDEINHWLCKVFEATESTIKSTITWLVTNIKSSPLICLKVNKTEMKSDWCVWMLFCQICGFKYDMASSFIKTYSCVTWEEVETLKSLKNQGSNFPYTLHIHFLCVQRDVLFISWMLLILIPLLRLLYVPSFFDQKE